jgi:membrane protein
MVDGPRQLTELSRRSWWGTLRRTAKGFREDNLSDLAAALTYYAVLSIFPGLLVLVSLLGLAGQSTTQPLIDSVTRLAPGAVRQILTEAVTGLQRSRGAGVIAILGLLGALWSASGYVGGFMRAANAVYEVPEGRPFWKTVPIRLGVTVVTTVLVAISALAVVVSGPLADRIGGFLGLKGITVTVFEIAKWPVLVLVVMLVLGLLYWASPNARPTGFRWISPGILLAVLLWIVTSAGFAAYVAGFSSFNKTYGVLAGVIVFLVWLWLTNIAILLGLEFDAELERARAIERGVPPDEEPFVPLRDDRTLAPDDNAHGRGTARVDRAG